jgi:hypothetical protein
METAILGYRTSFARLGVQPRQDQDRQALLKSMTLPTIPEVTPDAVSVQLLNLFWNRPTVTGTIDASEDRRFLTITRPRQGGPEDSIGQQGHPAEGDHQTDLVAGEQGQCEADGH